MDKYNFLTLGNDCSPAAALKDLNLRNFALPFDWVASSMDSLKNCLESNFSRYHTELKFNHNKTRLIDYYGFQFPHDYPINNTDMISDDTYIPEENGKQILDNWYEHYDNIKRKYDRRIERFINIIQDTKPIIVLCRYNTYDVLRLQEILVRLYNKNNIYFINSSTEEYKSKTIICCYTEKNGIWNETSIWKENIEYLIANL